MRVEIVNVESVVFFCLRAKRRRGTTSKKSTRVGQPNKLQVNKLRNRTNNPSNCNKASRVVARIGAKVLNYKTNYTAAGFVFFCITKTAYLKYKFRKACF